MYFYDREKGYVGHHNIDQTYSGEQKHFFEGLHW